MAGISIPEPPQACRDHIARVAPSQGDKWRWVQARWEAAADAKDAKDDICTKWIDDIREKFGAEK